MASNTPGPSGFEWTPEMNVGIERIDEQHREIFEAIAELAAGRRSTAEARASLAGIHELARTHFQTEERLLDELGHPLSPTHLAAHAQYLDRSQAILTSIDEDAEDGLPEILEFLRGWWVRVLLDEDAGIRVLVKRGDIAPR